MMPSQFRPFPLWRQGIDKVDFKPYASAASTATIYALASAPGRASVSIVRLSGSHALNTVAALSGQKDFPPRKMMVKKLRDPLSKEHLDNALVCYFPAPNSFTGEDVVELYLHGSPAVVRSVIGAIAKCPDTRPADAGEFSRRSFMNNKMSLLEIEGLADLMVAETESQRRCALRQMDGGLEGACDRWRKQIIECMAEVEALIDFGEDEADVMTFETSVLGSKVLHISHDIKKKLLASERVELVRTGVHIPIMGPPNAGKSSLINSLARRDVAIVSDIPGTTRDTIEVSLNLEGYSVLLIDTAGLRETTDTIEKQGIKRAQQRLESADMCVWVFDESSLALEMTDDSFVVHVFHEHVRTHSHQKQIIVFNKADLTPRHQPVHLDSIDRALRVLKVEKSQIVSLSCATGDGIQDFLDSLSKDIGLLFEGFNPESALLYRERHRNLMKACLDHLNRFLEVDPAQHPSRIEIAAEELRQAASCIGRITGRIDIEEVLDALFSEFCIGK